MASVNGLVRTLADTRPPASSTTTFATVQVSTATTTIIAANPERIGATIRNRSGSPLFVRWGPSASTIVADVQMSSNASYLELPFRYTGIITGVVKSSTGRCAVSEFFE